ncbi:unnamed protein product [Closterium sp. NIES-54]
MAAQELRWLTYLLIDLGEQPRSPPVLYVDNKAMLALCREHRLEHRTKHIALRYFLARELQQRGQLRLAYVASEANTADIFTKALAPGEDQRFCTLLGFPTYFLHAARPTVFRVLSLIAPPPSVSTLVVAVADFASTRCLDYATQLDSAPACPPSVKDAPVLGTDTVANAGVADTLEARLADARKLHEEGEYGSIPWAIAELGIRAQWATKHPSSPVSPRPVRNKGGVDDEVDDGARVSGNNGTKQRGVIKVNGGVNRSQLRVQWSTVAAGSSHADVDGRCRSPLRSGGGLSATTHGFDRTLAGGRRPEGLRRWHCANSARGRCRAAQGVLCSSLAHLHGHLEVLLAGGAAGTQELSKATRCWSPGMALHPVHESLDKDSITSYILQDEATQEAVQPMELLPQANHTAPTKLNQHQGQCGKPGGGGSGGGRSMRTLTRRGQRGTRAVEVVVDGRSARSATTLTNFPTSTLTATTTTRTTPREVVAGRPAVFPIEMQSRSKEKQTWKKTPSTKYVDNSSGQSRGDGEASCSMVGVVEPAVSLAPEAGEDFQVVAAAMHANSMAVLLDSDCSHHLMGTKAVFVDMAPSDDVKHLKESGVQLQGDGDEILLIPTTGEVLSQARYNGRVLCTDLHPCSMRSSSTKVVALRTIVSAMKSTPDWLHARLAHVGVDTIKSSAKHEVATGLNIKPSTRADPTCVSCVQGKLARHTFPDKGSDAEEALVVVHIDVCGPFWVGAKDSSLYFLLLKDHHTQFAKKSVLMLRSDQGGEFLGKEFTDFVDGKGIVHGLTCCYTPHQDGMAEREMRMAVESVRTMLLHMGMQHHWWHRALRQAVWVRNCLERSTTPPGTTPYQLLIRKKPDPTVGVGLHGAVHAATHRSNLEAAGAAGLPRLPAFTKVSDEVDDDLLYDDAEDDVDLPELDPDVHADPEHRWDIATMTVKEPMMAAMEEEIRSLIGMGTWELVERPHVVNIMKSRWVLTTKYRIDDTVEREKARLVVKGFTQVCGADYDETYSPVSSYVTEELSQHRRRPRPQLDAARHEERFCAEQARQGALHVLAGVLRRWDRPEEPGRRGALLQGRRQRSDLLGAGLHRRPARRQQQPRDAEGAKGVAGGFLRAARDLAGRQVPHNRPARKLWFHQQGYTDKLRGRFIDQEQGDRVTKTPVLVDAYAELKFDDEEAQEREEVGSL